MIEPLNNLKPLYNSLGQRVSAWNDPRLSPADKRDEWIHAHIRPELVHRSADGHLYADVPDLRL